MAIKARRYQHACIHHSGLGLQYCSGLYQDKLKTSGILPSMTNGYDCYQNALAERINGILNKNSYLIGVRILRSLND